MARQNTEPGIVRYLHAKGNKLGLPITGYFELTARCNFDCPMCYVHLKQEDVAARGRELSAEEWIGIAREARKQGMTLVLLTGGEPFVRKDFFEIYDALKDMGMIVSINSNGSMLSGEIRKKLIENPPSRINISLYGGCAETYCNMCGQNVFDQVLENIAVLKEAGINIAINHSITPYNQKDLERVYSICNDLGIQIKATSYMFPPVRVNGEFGGGNRLDPIQAAECMVKWDMLRLPEDKFAEKMEAIRCLRNIETNDCLVEEEVGISCRAGRSAFWMTWDGKMRPCGMMPYPEVLPMELGFETAWSKIREETSKIRLPVKCVGCAKRSICYACAAVCITETGAFDQVPQYACDQTDALIENAWKVHLEKKGG